MQAVAVVAALVAAVADSDRTNRRQLSYYQTSQSQVAVAVAAVAAAVVDFVDFVRTDQILPSTAELVEFRRSTVLLVRYSECSRLFQVRCKLPDMLITSRCLPNPPNALVAPCCC